MRQKRQPLPPSLLLARWILSRECTVVIATIILAVTTKALLLLQLLLLPLDLGLWGNHQWVEMPWRSHHHCPTQRILTWPRNPTSIHSRCQRHHHLHHNHHIRTHPPWRMIHSPCYPPRHNNNNNSPQQWCRRIRPRPWILPTMRLIIPVTIHCFVIKKCKFKQFFWFNWID